VGYASRAQFTVVAFTGLPAFSVNRHSLEAWIWVDGATTGLGYTRVVTRGTEYKLGVNNAGQAEMEIFDGGVKVQAGATVLQPRTLYHLAMCYDGTNCRLYVNGVLDGTMAAGLPADSYGTVLDVCSRAGGVNQNVMVLAVTDANNVVWSDGEVFAHYRDPWCALVWPQSEFLPLELKAGGTVVPPVVLGNRLRRGPRRIYLPIEQEDDLEIVMPSNIVRADNDLPDDDEDAWILLG
jgi:hypothetical protein